MKNVIKKVLVLFLAFLVFTLTACGYSKSDVARARREGYEEGYERGYNEATYYAKGELERVSPEAEERAYEAGYDAGYDAGYWDALDEAGLNPYHGSGEIEKD